MKLSKEGAAFIAAHEGFRSRAYKDPVGVITIGYGFTNRSAAFSAYWRKKHGREMRLGDTIGKHEAIELLASVANEEYGAAVNRHIGTRKQHEYDGATSACYNLGPGAAKWDWGRALKAGDARGAAQALLKYNKAGGRRLPGLVRRRKEEARLIRDGVYTGVASEPDKDEIENQRRINLEYQGKLRQLGFYNGDIDGIFGPKTKAAVLAFQEAHPDLVADGLLGPATMASVDRSIAKRGEGEIIGQGGTGAAALGLFGLFATDWSWGSVLLLVAVGAVALGAGIYVYQKRGSDL